MTWQGAAHIKMEDIMKKKICIYVTALFVCLLAACGKNETAIAPSATEEPKTKTIQTLDIYTIKSASSGDPSLSPIQVKYDKKNASLKDVINLVTENLDEEVSVVSSKLDGDTAILNFSKKTAPVTGCSAPIEGLILDCYANSILDNVKGCKYVIVRSGTEAYESGHYSFGEDEVYASK